MSAIIISGLKNALKGALAGALASAVGYAKQEQIGNWQFDKMFKTVLVGAITTAIIGGAGLPLPALAVLIANWLGLNAGIFVEALFVEGVILTSIVIVADEVVKVVARRTPAGEWFNKIRDLIALFLSKMGEAVKVKKPVVA